MTREEIREHWADIVAAVFDAEGKVTPTLKERKSALGNNPTQEQIDVLAREWCLAVADEILSNHGQRSTTGRLSRTLKRSM